MPIIGVLFSKAGMYLVIVATFAFMYWRIDYLETKSLEKDYSIAVLQEGLKVQKDYFEKKINNAVISKENELNVKNLVKELKPDEKTSVSIDSTVIQF